MIEKFQCKRDVDKIHSCVFGSYDRYSGGCKTDAGVFTPTRFYEVYL